VRRGARELGDAQSHARESARTRSRSHVPLVRCSVADGHLPALLVPLATGRRSTHAFSQGAGEEGEDVPLSCRQTRSSPSSTATTDHLKLRSTPSGRELRASTGPRRAATPGMLVGQRSSASQAPKEDWHRHRARVAPRACAPLHCTGWDIHTTPHARLGWRMRQLQPAPIRVYTVPVHRAGKPSEFRMRIQRGWPRTSRTGEAAEPLREPCAQARN